MRWFVTPIIFITIIWILAAFSCEKKLQRLETGVVWNRANGTRIDVVWNPQNPCYTGPCNTFTRTPNYRTSGTPNPRPNSYPYNPFPFCFSCHGSGEWIYSNLSSTVMTYYSSSYRIQHSK